MRAPARPREPALGASPDLRELAKLGLQASPTSIRRLLARAQLRPAPRRSGPSWREFLHAQAASIVACDFFTVESVLLRRYYVLFFIEHGTRRVHLAGCTSNPDGSWVTQQARNLGLVLPEQQIRFLIRDRDSKYSGPFDQVFRSEQIRIVRTPVRAPKANAVAERFVRTLRAECLDWLLILNRRHLERVLRVYVEHYNAERPHRALADRVDEPFRTGSRRARPQNANINRRDRGAADAGKDAGAAERLGHPSDQDVAWLQEGATQLLRLGNREKPG